MISTYANKLFKATFFDGVIDPYKARVFGRATIIWATINMGDPSYSHFVFILPCNATAQPTPTTDADAGNS